MGRHSARSRASRRLGRTARNAMYVVTATSVATVLVFAGVSTFAAAKNAEIPSPTIEYWSQPAYPATAPQDAYASDAYSEPAAQDDGAMRRCPVTGCAASSCHAETGEPTPRW